MASVEGETPENRPKEETGVMENRPKEETGVMSPVEVYAVQGLILAPTAMATKKRDAAAKADMLYFDKFIPGVEWEAVDGDHPAAVTARGVNARVPGGKMFKISPTGLEIKVVPRLAAMVQSEECARAIAGHVAAHRDMALFIVGGAPRHPVDSPGYRLSAELAASSIDITPILLAVPWSEYYYRLAREEAGVPEDFSVSWGAIGTMPLDAEDFKELIAFIQPKVVWGFNHGNDRGLMVWKGTLETIQYGIAPHVMERLPVKPIVLMDCCVPAGLWDAYSGPHHCITSATYYLGNRDMPNLKFIGMFTLCVLTHLGAWADQWPGMFGDQIWNTVRVRSTAVSSGALPVAKAPFPGFTEFVGKVIAQTRIYQPGEPDTAIIRQLFRDAGLELQYDDLTAEGLQLYEYISFGLMEQGSALPTSDDVFLRTLCEEAVRTNNEDYLKQAVFPVYAP